MGVGPPMVFSDALPDLWATACLFPCLWAPSLSPLELPSPLPALQVPGEQEAEAQRPLRAEEPDTQA